jgi:hypothetical protein
VAVSVADPLSAQRAVEFSLRITRRITTANNNRE